MSDAGTRTKPQPQDEQWDPQWEDVWREGAGLDPVARALWDVAFDFWDRELGIPGRVLEVGCGIARQAARLQHAGAQCIGVDLSTEALTNALIERRVKGDAYQLPFPPATFDVVWSGGLLEHFEDPSPLLAEMARVLAPGGVIGATVIPRKRSGQSAIDAMAAFAKGTLAVVTLRFGRLKGVRRQFPFYESTYGPDEYRAWLDRLGFDADIRPYSLFPAVPKGGERYASFIRRRRTKGVAFNRSRRRLAFAWAPAFSIVARRRADLGRVGGAEPGATSSVR